MFEKGLGVFQVVVASLRIKPVGIGMIRSFVGQRAQQLVDFTDGLAA